MKIFGPSTLIAAAFIGPGTITICTLAGVNHGYDLLFALLFSTIATIVLQEMSARLGIVNQAGLGKTIRNQRSNGIQYKIMFVLVALSVILGNSAYEAGNISGSVIGFELIFHEVHYAPIVLGLFAFALLYFGSYQLIEKVLIAMVLAISVSFVITIFLIQPDVSLIFRGFIPKVSEGIDWKVLVALVGTTVVPYNLFLHASIIHKKYKHVSEINEMRKENRLSIGLGGLISMFIVIVAANSKGLSEVKSPTDLAIQLEPLLGKWSEIGIGIGLFAAGLSSAITAPLAAGLVARELFDWKENEIRKYRFVWMAVLFFGTIISSLGIKPLLIIQFAQMLNGILLPIIAIYLLILVNKKQVLRQNINSSFQNLIGSLVVVITLFISFRMLYSLFS